MSKGFKITGPGRYADRDGNVWTIVENKGGECLDDPSSYPWKSVEDSVRGHKRTWTNDGQYSDVHSQSRCDLIRRLPDRKPRKAKRKARYGVWVECASRVHARGVRDDIAGKYTHWFKRPTVRRLPC